MNAQTAQTKMAMESMGSDMTRALRIGTEMKGSRENPIYFSDSSDDEVPLESFFINFITTINLKYSKCAIPNSLINESLMVLIFFFRLCKGNNSGKNIYSERSSVTEMICKFG